MFHKYDDAWSIIGIEIMECFRWNGQPEAFKYATAEWLEHRQSLLTEREFGSAAEAGLTACITVRGFRAYHQRLIGH